MIYEYNLVANIVINSSNPWFLIMMRLVARDILIIYNLNSDRTSFKEGVEDSFAKISWINLFMQKQLRRIIRPDILGVNVNTDDKLIKTLINHGYPVIVDAVNDLNIAQDLFKMGVNSIQTSKALEMLSKISNSTITLHDAGGSTFHTLDIVNVRTEQDVTKAVERAKIENKKITIAGSKHSMGGQTQYNSSIHLNMLGLNHVIYDSEKQTVLVGAGANWNKVMKCLNKHGRSIKVAQSDNIFSVGGSISVNVHGWQVKSPPIISTIKTLKIVTIDNEVLTISKDSHPNLFNAIIGGYGLFAIILESEIQTVPNNELTFHSKFFSTKDFEERYNFFVSENPKVELAYGRLSLDEDNLFQEAGLFWYENIYNNTAEKGSKIEKEKFVALKRTIFRYGEYFNFGKNIRWFLEKQYARFSEGQITSRNTAMYADIHVLWPLSKDHRDILHEYFIPKGQLYEFLNILKEAITEYRINVLNITIREVLKDSESILAYAKHDSFGVVCFFHKYKRLWERRI